MLEGCSHERERMALTFRSGIVRVRQDQIYCLARLEGEALRTGKEKGHRAFGNLVLRFQLRSMSHGLFQLKDDFNGLDAIRAGAVPVAPPAAYGMSVCSFSGISSRMGTVWRSIMRCTRGGFSPRCMAFNRSNTSASACVRR